MQRYYFFKKELPVWNAITYPFPLEVEHIFDDCVFDLRPKFHKATSYAKACEQIENMEKEFVNLINQQKAKESANQARDVNLAPITEDEEVPAAEEDEEEEVEEEEEEEEDEGEDGEVHGTVRSRRPRISGGSAADEEGLDTDENEVNTFVEEANPMKNNTTERTKIVSEEDAEFMKAFDAVIAESVSV